MTQRFIFTMNKLGRFVPPDREVLSGITLAFIAGAKIGVLGPNGAGKTTLLRIMAGLDDGYSGEARLTPGFSVGLLAQEPELDPAKDVLGNVMDGAGESAALLAEYEQILAAWSDPQADFDKLGARQADVETKIAAAGAWELQRSTEIVMDALRTPPGDSPVGHLSGGERRRVALARLLLAKPDLLLLDEPTNHLDAESVAWLERTLADYAGTVVAVTHDRYFLDNVAGWILELDRGRGIPFEGNYSGFLAQKQDRLDRQAKDDDRRTRTLKRELEWIKMAPKARQAKGKARLNQYQKLLDEQQAAAGPGRDLEISIPVAERLGDLVIEADSLTVGFDGRLLIDGLSFSLPPAGIVGVIGANGSGKSTLLKMIVAAAKAEPSEPAGGGGAESALRPDGGSLRIGPTVRLGYVDQERTLDPANTVYTEIVGDVDHLEIAGRSIHGRAYVASFNFRGADQQKRVGDLSGGERNRVHLAKVLLEGANVLLLDEPTNDLDVDTLRALEDALAAFAGCAVIVSHDRWFLDRVATHILAFEGGSQVRWFEGAFSEYAEFRRREHGVDAMRPQRIKYKPFSRSR